MILTATEKLSQLQSGVGASVYLEYTIQGY